MINNIILACSEYFKFTFALSVGPRNEFEFYINDNLLFARISEVFIILTLSFRYFPLLYKIFENVYIIYNFYGEIDKKIISNFIKSIIIR